MDKIKQWLASHSITTHTVAVIAAGAIAAYQDVPAFHDFVLSVYAHIPNGLHNAVTAGIAVYMWYRRGQQP